MKNHLTSEEIAAVVAGLELEDAARDHLVGCVVCRAEVADLESLIAARRAAILTEEPDWDDQAERIMAPLSHPTPGAAGAMGAGFVARPPSLTGRSATFSATASPPSGRRKQVLGTA